MSARKSRRSPTGACTNQGVNKDDGGSSSSSSQGSLSDEVELTPQTVGQESLQVPAKRGRGRPRKSKTSPAKRRTATPSKPRGAKKQRSATSNSVVVKGTPKNGKGKEKAGGSDSVELQGARYIGERVAVDFPPYGVFIGEVVKVKGKGTLCSVRFEDGDKADYDMPEIEKHMKLYTDLSESFAVTPIEGEDDESQNDDDTATPRSKGKAKGKGKRKGTHIDARVRMFFPRQDNYYKGTVTEHLAPEDDDDYGDLYRVTYDDGDVEDLDSEELEEGMALYNYGKRYPLVRKKVSMSTSTTTSKKVFLFGEKRAGSPIFATVKGYHDDGTYNGRFKETS